MTVVHDKGLKRDIGKTGLLFTGVGSIIGSGWLFGAFDAASMAGPAAILSWALGAVLIVFVALNYSELGVMFPVAGGVVRYPHYAFGSFASYTSGWITWLSAAGTVGIEVLAAVQYASSYMPWLMETKEGVLVLTVPGIFVSIAMVAVFCIINMFGVKFFAQFNNVLVWWKLLVIVLVFVGLALLAFNPGHFHMPEFGGFAPNGIAPIFAALPAAGIVFSYLGFRQGVEFAGETKNPQKNVPFAVIGSIVLTGIIYILLQIAFIGAIPTDLLKDGWGGLSFSNSAGPWAEIAIMLGAMWLAIILYIDAVVSPADTGLIFTALTPRLSYSQARVGQCPECNDEAEQEGHPVVRSGGDVHRRLLPVLPIPVVGEDGRLHHLRHRHLLRVRAGHGGGSAPGAAQSGTPVPSARAETSCRFSGSLPRISSSSGPAGIRTGSCSWRWCSVTWSSVCTMPSATAARSRRCSSSPVGG